jgi:predicted nucleotidyltransferase
MSAVERLGIGQVLGPKRGIRPQELGLARPQSSGLDQHPDRDPGPDDARVTAADRRVGLDTWVAVSQIAHNPLKNPSFLPLSHLGEQPLGFLKLGHRRSSLDLMISSQNPPVKSRLLRQTADMDEKTSPDHLPARLILPVLGTIIPNMRIDMVPSTRLAAVLFSPVQQRVLALLFGQPGRSFQSAEVITLAGSGTGAVHRQLIRLADSGLVTVTRVGNQKHYQANRDSAVFSELHGLVVKTIGLAGPLEEALAPFKDRIQVAFVYGSIAKGTDTAQSDIDLMVICDDLAYSDLYSALQKAEAALGRPVQVSLSTVAEWTSKLAAGNPFVTKIQGQPKIPLIGSVDDLA